MRLPTLINGKEAKITYTRINWPDTVWSSMRISGNSQMIVACLTTTTPISLSGDCCSLGGLTEEMPNYHCVHNNTDTVDDSELSTHTSKDIRQIESWCVGAVGERALNYALMGLLARGLSGDKRVEAACWLAGRPVMYAAYTHTHTHLLHLHSPAPIAMPSVRNDLFDVTSGR